LLTNKAIFHLDKIYSKISEARIIRVTKASTAHGQMHPIFSNKGPRKIIQAEQVFERLQVDLVDLSRRPVVENDVEYLYALVVVDIFSRYLFLRPLTSKSSGTTIAFHCNNYILPFFYPSTANLKQRLSSKSLPISVR